MSGSREFARFANLIAHLSGRPVTFVLCLAVVIAWAVTGPIFDFSDTWQLIINTGTTIVTFLMVFLIQNTQNRDGLAIQTKLDELIRVSTVPNRYVGIERLTEEELERLRRKCEKRARLKTRSGNGNRRVKKTNEKAGHAIARAKH